MTKKEIASTSVLCGIIVAVAAALQVPSVSFGDVVLTIVGGVMSIVCGALCAAFMYGLLSK